MIETLKKELFAVIDLGSNSFHLVIWEWSKENGKRTYFEKVSDRQLVQIGYGLREGGTLDPTKEADVFSVLKTFNAQIAHIPTTHIRAVGTQVFRKITDSHFLPKAEEALGQTIDIISGDDEAELIYQGVTQNLYANSEYHLIVDIGGASSEFILGNQNGIVGEISLDLGCVTASRRYFPNGKVNQSLIDDGLQILNEELNQRLTLEIPKNEISYIGASGTIRAITALTKQTFGRESEAILYIDDVRRLIALLVDLGEIEAIQTHFSIPKETASILPAGALLIEAIFSFLAVKELTITEASMREGILLQLMDANKNMI